MTGNSSDFTVQYTPPLRLDPTRKYEAALLSIDLYNSLPNITDENNTLKYSTDSGTTWKTINLPTGSYEVKNINEEITRIMKENNDYISSRNQAFINVKSNASTLKSIVEVLGKNVKLDLDTLGPTLGFCSNTTKILGEGYHESPNIVNIMKITSILVNLDIISGSYVNGAKSPVIYSFFPNVPPGYKIVERPRPSLVYYPVNRFDIDSMRIWLTDQNNQKVDFRGETVTVRIAIREIFNLKREIEEAIKNK